MEEEDPLFIPDDVEIKKEPESDDETPGFFTGMLECTITTDPTLDSDEEERKPMIKVEKFEEEETYVRRKSVKTELTDDDDDYNHHGDEEVLKEIEKIKEKFTFSADSAASGEKSEKRFKCSDCGKKFQKKSKLIKHEEKHKKGEAEKCVHVCPQCGKGFKLKIILDRHVLIHREDKPEECKICFKRFKHRPGLLNHMAVHTKPFVCKICNKGFSVDRSLQAHSLRHLKRNVTCNYCDRTFLNKKEHSIHMKKHHRGLPAQAEENSPVACTICKEMFINLDLLKDHVTAHPTKKPFQCESCTRSYFEKGALLKHMKAVHLGIPPPEPKNGRIPSYVCEHCEKSFYNKRAYRMHLASHSDERPHKCSTCGKGFKRRDALGSHVRTLHNEMRVLYPCQLCGKIFNWKSNFLRHTRAHAESQDAEVSEREISEQEVRDLGIPEEDSN